MCGEPDEYTSVHVVECEKAQGGGDAWPRGTRVCRRRFTSLYLVSSGSFCVATYQHIDIDLHVFETIGTRLKEYLPSCVWLISWERKWRNAESEHCREHERQ
jgi:hypothetical protein